SFLQTPSPPRSTLFPYTTLFRSHGGSGQRAARGRRRRRVPELEPDTRGPGAGDARRGAGPSRPSLRRTRAAAAGVDARVARRRADRKSTRLNSSHVKISYAVFCL